MNNTDLIKILADGPFETNGKKMHWTECFSVFNSVQPYQNSRVFCYGMYTSF